MNKTTWKSFGAVLAGCMTILVLHTGMDTLLGTLYIFARYPQPFNEIWMGTGKKNAQGQNERESDQLKEK